MLDVHFEGSLTEGKTHNGTGTKGAQCTYCFARIDLYNTFRGVLTCESPSSFSSRGRLLYLIDSTHHLRKWF